jgi:general secretion pathway protein F
MPVFEYIAINPAGKKVKGTLDADSVRTARTRLRAQGIFPTDIKESIENRAESRDVKRFLTSNRVSTRDLSIATRQLATLTAAGLPLVSCLNALSEQTGSMALKRVVVEIREKVEEGSSLANAMSGYPKAFPRLYVNMVAAGEASGTLDAVLENLADYLEGQLDLKHKVTSALFYPVLVLAFSTLVVIALFTLVVPSIVDIFQKQGAVLPFPTRLMIGISDVLISGWYLIAALIAGVVYGVIWYYKQEAGRERIDRILLNLPVYGSLYRRIATARVANTLGTLLSSGVGLLTALDICRNIVNNVHIARALEDAREGVREGKSLAKELSKCGFFPSMLSHMIAVGETSGKLEHMLGKAGSAYDNEVNAALGGLTSLIGPLMIIILGGIVLFIVMSILLPMVDLINVVQS